MRQLFLLAATLVLTSMTTANSQRSNAATFTNNTSLNELLRPLQNNFEMKFFEHIVKDDPTSFGNVLAMNIRYEPILAMRKIVEDTIGRPLDFLKSWDPNGEAHVTTITPPEFVFRLREHISMQRIHEIARTENIQSSNIEILGIGSGKKVIDGSEEETFFVIVDSPKLRKIRRRIYKEFVANGGTPDGFDPTRFFPHITIGYTKQDLHENDGVLKDLAHSLDERFGTVDRSQQ